MVSFLFLPLFVALCAARPQEQSPAPTSLNPAPNSLSSAPKSGENASAIPIVSQSEENSPDGSFQFSYETGNGIKFEEKGYLKDGANASEKIQVIEGTVSYTDNEGNPVNLKFIADENGFQPEGDHIPKAPASQAGGASPAEPEPYSGQTGRGFGSQPSSAQPGATQPSSAQPSTAQPIPSTASQSGGAQPQTSPQLS